MLVFDLFGRIGADTKDLDDALDKSEKKGSAFASKLTSVLATGAKIIGAASAAAVTAGAGAVAGLAKQAVQAYGNFEQLEGGVKKIFGDDVAKTVIDNADKAFSTAGLSANEYMETVTSFSASLINSLKGDTEKAASLADLAMRDMSDNANTFGTDMKSIMNAYQGFSKQNYTMLDNLKLGYGGTKSEMDRLVKDAMKLDDTFKANTKTVEENKNKVKELDPTYADIVKAIHIIQQNMNIAGTTSKEASSTIQGSLGALSASWKNLMTGLGQEGVDLTPLVNNVVSNAKNVINNIKPIALQAVKGISTVITEIGPVLATELPPLIAEVLPPLAKSVVLLLTSLGNTLPTLIEAILPSVLTGVTSVVQSLISAFPTILNILSSQLPVILQQLIPAILQLLPMLIQAGIEFVLALAKGLADNINLLMDAIMSIIHYLVDELLTPDNIAQFLIVASKIILAIVEGIIKNIPEILGAIVILIGNIIQGLGKALPEVGSNIIEFIVNLGKTAGNKMYELFGDGFYNLLVGIGKWVQNIVNKVTSVWNTIVGKVKEIFGNVRQAIADKFTEIKDKITEIWDSITKKITGVATAAKTWGKDLIDNFINGLKEKVKKLSDTIKGIADKVKAFLGFSEPKEGPLSNFHTYAPDMIDLFTKGIIDGKSKLQKALNEVAVLPNQAFTGLSVDGVDGANMVSFASKPSIEDVTINVYASEGQDVRQLAKEVTKEIQNLITDKEKAYGLA